MHCSRAVAQQATRTWVYDVTCLNPEGPDGVVAILFDLFPGKVAKGVTKRGLWAGAP